jgi:hypothetical protein
VLALQLAAAAGLRLFALVRYRVDSDEPQHLHVVWGWVRGLIPYRDFYDNHMPLFHLLFAPVVGAIGETPRILFYARLLMLPLALASIALTYVIAARLFDRTTALWAALVVSVFPTFLLKSLEFRNDNLCVLLTLAAVALILNRRSPARAFAVGLILGVSLAVSIKTIVILGALAIAFLKFDRRPRLWLAAAAGVAVVPLLVAAFFAAHGALDDLVYCAIELNGRVPVPPWRRIGGIAVSAVVTFVTLRRAKTLLGAVPALFVGVLFAVSPVISPRDYLPILPLVAILAVHALRQRQALLQALPPLLMLLTFVEGELWRRPDDYPRRLIADTLRLTTPAERVLDLKGETVYRERPAFIALERVGREMLALGQIDDTFARDVVARRTYVVTRDSEFFPARSRAFLHDHFVPVGTLRVAGQRVRDDGTFTIVVPGPYALIADDGSVVSSRWYEAGRHRAASRGMVLWSRAVERGFTPASPPPPDRRAHRTTPPAPLQQAQSTPRTPLRSPRRAP